MEKTKSFTLYHGTIYEFGVKIIKNGYQISKDRDDHWLGYGVYFYDNYAQAEWWSRNTAKKNKIGEEYSVVLKNEICIEEDNILDFRSREDVEEKLTCIKDIIRRIEIDQNGYTEEEFYHKKRCAFCNLIFSRTNLKLLIANIERHRDNKVNDSLRSFGIVIDFETQFCLREPTLVKKIEILENEVV